MSILGVGPFKSATIGNYTATQAVDTGIAPEPGDIIYVQVGESNSWTDWKAFDYAQWNALTGVAAGTVSSASNSLRDSIIVAAYDSAIFKISNGNLGVTSRTTNNLIDRIRIATGPNAGQFKENSSIKHDLG